jgi:enoyl-CoA hydratase/carnithine racemase
MMEKVTHAMAASDALVLFEQTDAIARITESTDKLNAINHQLGLQLWAAFARCQDEPSIRAIVLAGAGRALCAGDELGRDRRRRRSRTTARSHQPLRGRARGR